MGNKKQFQKLLAEKQAHDNKKNDKKIEIKSSKIQEIKKKLGEFKERKKRLSKVEKLSLKSKGIKKVDPIKAAEEKQKKIKAVKPKIDDYASFVKSENHAYQQLRKHKELIKKATKSLIKYHSGAKNSNDLLDQDDDFIYIEVVLSKIPEEYSVRPLQIPLPNPIYSVEQSSKFCIFTKDPQREYKDKIKNLNIPTVARVIGFSKIDKKFPTYKDKLKLFYSYDLFFVDHSIYDLIRKPTGKIFYERKKQIYIKEQATQTQNKELNLEISKFIMNKKNKLFDLKYFFNEFKDFKMIDFNIIIPFPINCKEVPAPQKEQFGEDYQAYLNDLVNYTYFSMGNGPVYTIKIARVNMDVKDIVKNVIHGIYNSVPHLLKQKIKHNRVRQINLKTFNSISLPIFNQLTDDEQTSIVAE